MALRQGDSYSLPIKILINDALLDIGLVELVEFMFGEIRKVYPTEVTYDTDHFIIPLTQQETFSLEEKQVEYQARVKFNSGEVKGSPVKKCNLYNSISQEVL